MFLYNDTPVCYITTTLFPYFTIGFNLSATRHKTVKENIIFLVHLNFYTKNTLQQSELSKTNYSKLLPNTTWQTLMSKTNQATIFPA